MQEEKYRSSQERRELSFYYSGHCTEWWLSNITENSEKEIYLISWQMIILKAFLLTGKDENIFGTFEEIIVEELEWNVNFLHIQLQNWKNIWNPYFPIKYTVRCRIPNKNDTGIWKAVSSSFKRCTDCTNLSQLVLQRWPTMRFLSHNLMSSQSFYTKWQSKK